MERSWGRGAAELDPDHDRGEWRGRAPGKCTLTSKIHRSAAAPAPATAAPPPMAPGDAFGAATSGAASPVPHGSYLEEIFGMSFAGVQAHVGTPEAQAGLSALGARAAAFGDQIAFADASPDLHLTAHEVAHVVQHRNGGDRVQAKAARVSDPGDDAELAADRAADAAVRGERVTDVGRADGVALHRTAVATNGGVFDDHRSLVPHDATAVGGTAGAHINLQFTANDLVETAPNAIALIQTVRAMSNQPITGGPLHATNDVVHTGALGHADADQARVVAPGGPGAGRAIDGQIHRPDPAAPTDPTHDRGDANHNPIYGVGYDAPDPSRTLAGGTPAPPAARGDHVRLPAGGLAPARPAVVSDDPSGPHAVAGRTAAFEAEVAAIVTHASGAPTETPANTYLGSVSWGFTADGAGHVVTQGPTLLSLGAPTASFAGAAGQWNSSVFHQHADGTGAAVPTIPVPIATPTAGAAAAPGAPTSARLPSAMTARELIAQLRTTGATMSGGAGVAHTDRVNQIFQMRAAAAELRRRTFTVTVHATRLQDTGPAARPPEDEIAVSVAAATRGAPASTTHRIRRGDDDSFPFLAADVMEPDDPHAPPTFPRSLRVRLTDHDRAPRGPGTDDTLLDFTWDDPFAPRTATHGGYTATIGFDA